MLNHVISLLRRERVCGWLGRSRSQRLVIEIVRWADYEHDCRAFEILEGHGSALGVCSNCLKPAKGVVEELCPKCRAGLYSLESEAGGGALVKRRPSKRAHRTS
jgi:hypothetical protein